MLFIKYFLLLLKKIGFIVKKRFLVAQFFSVATLFIHPLLKNCQNIQLTLKKRKSNSIKGFFISFKFYFCYSLKTKHLINTFI